jgi:hypothetical protein
MGLQIARLRVPLHAAHDAGRFATARWACHGKAHAACGQDAKDACRAVKRA